MSYRKTLRLVLEGDDQRIRSEAKLACQSLALPIDAEGPDA